MNRTTTMHRAIVTALLVVGLATGCAPGGPEMQKDAAGLTQEQVRELTLHQEYDRYRDHYQHMQRLLEGAQLAVHDGEWEWVAGDGIPGIGGDGVAPLPGADTKNSYFLTSGRIWMPPGATGAQRDLDPMIEYFEHQGWAIDQRAISDSYEVWANTGDGWQINYSLRTNGRYSLDVYSELFWTNDALDLSTAVYGRSALQWPDDSVPGEHPVPPSWESPIINQPEI
jgi:hypothetical protein